MGSTVTSHFFFFNTVVPIDSSAPVISNCPESRSYTVPIGTPSTTASWVEPTATDNSNVAPTVDKSHTPGDSFDVGTTIVTYRYSDGAGNLATCSFAIMGNLFVFFYNEPRLYSKSINWLRV